MCPTIICTQSHTNHGKPVHTMTADFLMACLAALYDALLSPQREPAPAPRFETLPQIARIMRMIGMCGATGPPRIGWRGPPAAGYPATSFSERRCAGPTPVIGWRGQRRGWLPSDLRSTRVSNKAPNFQNQGATGRCPYASDLLEATVDF